MILRLCVWILGFIGTLWAGGSYGPNKVQYTPFDWKKVETRHFDIYFYDQGDSLAAYAARTLENMHDSVATGLGIGLQQRIPVILHNTHAQFQQTNVLRYPIPEAVGGFTEVFKNRIVIPFDGSYPSLHHVLQHEFVHALTFDMLSGGGRGMRTAQKLSRMPLWLAEGTAEFLSLGWDISGEGFVADAVTSGYAMNPANDFGGFFAYKGGQSFLYFMESVFGRGAVRDLYNQIRDGYPFPIAFKRVTRVDLEEAGEIWLRELRRIYWPELGRRTFGKNVARALTDHRREENFYNVGSSLSPDGRYVAFFSDRGNREAIYILDTRTEKITSTALESGHIGAHESFNSFNSSLGWSPDSKTLALVSKQAGKNVIHLLDVARSRIVGVLKPDLDAISSPAFSPSGDTLVFTGQKGSQRDLYLMDKNGKQLRALTNDKAAEGNPVYSPSGRYIAYSTDLHTDLNDRWQRKKSDLYLLDLQTSSTRRLSLDRWSSSDPSFGPSDSLLVFVSNRSGIDNIYMQEVFGDSVWNVTNLLAGASSPSWSRDGSSLAFTLFERGGFDVYLMRNPIDKRQKDTLEPSLFVKMAQDSSGSVHLWNPLVISNLRSFDSTVRVDTIGQFLRDRESMVAQTAKDTALPPWEPPPEEGLLRTPPKRLRPEKTLSDSVAQPTVLNPDSSDSFVVVKTVVVDSLSALPRQRAPMVRPPIDTIAFPRKHSFGPDSTLLTHRYIPEWSLDQAMAMAGFSNLEGVGGQASLVFSDLMGEREFSFWMYSGGGSLTDINAFASYEYLRLRPDFSLSYLHTAGRGTELMSYQRYLETHPPLSTPPLGSPDSIQGMVPYRDENTSIALGVAYPLSIYSRFALSTDVSWRTRTYQHYSGESSYNWSSGSYEYDLTDNPDAQNQDLNTLGARLSWSFDNAEWGWVGPVLGERLWAGVHVVPPGLLQKESAYWNAELDMRKYFKFLKRYTLATRVLAGMSEPFSGYRNPHAYLLGGDAWTLNWHFNDENYHASLDETTFAGWETPLRAFRYHEFRGSRMGLLNVEWRFPLIEVLQFGWPIPLGIRNVAGVLFSDIGGTWEDRRFMENRGWGYGWGWRMNLGVFVLRYSKAWGVHRFSTEKPGARVYWSLGADF
jgi:WD40 repeat protein